MYEEPVPVPSASFVAAFWLDKDQLWPGCECEQSIEACYVPHALGDNVQDQDVHLEVRIRGLARDLVGPRSLEFGRTWTGLGVAVSNAFSPR